MSDILHAAMFEQLCEKIMVPTFDPDTQPLPSWLTDRTLLQLCAPALLYSSIALWRSQRSSMIRFHIRYVKPRDDIGWETHTQRCRDVFSVKSKLLHLARHSCRVNLHIHVNLHSSHATYHFIINPVRRVNTQQVCHRTFQFSYRYMSMRQRRVYRSNLEVVRMFPRLSDALRNELSRIRCIVPQQPTRFRVRTNASSCSPASLSCGCSGERVSA